MRWTTCLAKALPAGDLFHVPRRALCCHSAPNARCAISCRDSASGHGHDIVTYTTLWPMYYFLPGVLFPILIDWQTNALEAHMRILAVIGALAITARIR